MWALNFLDLSHFCSDTEAFSHFVWFEHMSIFHLIIVLITYHITLHCCISLSAVNHLQSFNELGSNLIMAALIRVERIPGTIGSEIRNDSASRSGDIIMTLLDGCQVNDRYLVGLPHRFNNGIEFQVGINVGPLIW